MEIIRKLWPDANGHWLCSSKWFTKNFSSFGLTDFSQRKHKLLVLVLPVIIRISSIPIMITLGIGYWSCLWSPLLLLVQVCGQESPILPDLHAQVEICLDQVL